MSLANSGGMEIIMKRIAILGSTGSIGTQTLDVVRKNQDIEVVALAVNSSIEVLEQQIREFHPKIVCVYAEKKAEELKGKINDLSVSVTSGMNGLIECACYNEVEIVVTAMVGMIGIQPTIAAIRAKKDIALANKETLVTAGHLIMPLVKEYGVKLLPVDSEHSAIFQSLNGQDANSIRKILLTASGGPFRGKTKEELGQVTVENALKHPNWSMGRKITIDSATMVNKGLEVIEAKWLFDVDFHQVEVVVHPQSIIHSAVEYSDGAVIAQLGVPDMKLPIQYALYYPKRLQPLSEPLDLFKLGQMTFEKPDLDTFQGLKLAYECGERGGSLPTVFNAANELAVAKFLNREIGFLQIYELIQASVNAHNFVNHPTVEQILDTEAWTYDYINNLLKK